MLLVIAIIALVVGIVWHCRDDWSMGAMVTEVTASLVLVIMIAVIAVNFIGVDASVASMKTRYEMLTYQYENDFYENDNDVGKYQLVAHIRSWNEDLSRYRKLQRDFWVGVFIPNIYDQFEYIDISK